MALYNAEHKKLTVMSVKVEAHIDIERGGSAKQIGKKYQEGRNKESSQS